MNNSLLEKISEYKYLLFYGREPSADNYTEKPLVGIFLKGKILRLNNQGKAFEMNCRKALIFTASTLHKLK